MGCALSTLTDHWRTNIAPVWKSHWGDSLVITTRSDTVTLTGVVFTLGGEQLDEEGFQVISHDAEIMFLTSDVGSVCIDEGTTICHTTPGNKIVHYRVVSDDGEPAWEYDDPDHIKMRVRCKRIKIEDALS